LHNVANGPVSDLAVNVYDRSNDGSLRIDFNANPTLYRAEDNTAHHRRFLALLGTLADADPDQPLNRIEILSVQERHQLLNTWNDTAAPIPATTVPGLFEAQVAGTPDNTAVVFDDTTLTYAQLNTAANQLAHLLIDRGVGPEQIIALALPRSLDMIIALLGVLKTGAAYLPLDPNYPPARLAVMLTDAAPVMAITTTQLKTVLPDNHPIPQLILDDPPPSPHLANTPTSGTVISTV
jgi:non-ribosomal peptide synthetase component F